jgi:hypothetical protein
MKRLLLLLIITFPCISPAFSQVFTYTDTPVNEGFNLSSSGHEGVALTYSIHQFSLEDLNLRGEAMKTIKLAGHFLPGDEGAPDLPGGGKYIALPQGSTPVLHITSMKKEVIHNVDIAPAPRIPKENENGPLDYNKSMAIYSRDAFYPSEPIQLSTPTKVRGVDAVIIGITPFQYNPVTRDLIVYRDIEVEVEFEGGNGHFGDDRLRSRWWDPLLNDLFINYTQIPAIDYTSRQLTVGSRQSAGNRETGYEYLIICPNDPVFMNWADTLRLFRTMQGIYTGVVTTAEIGGNTVDDIESFVNNAYANWDIPPAAILLLGDYGTFGSTINSPVWDNYCVSDHIYADVDNDEEEEIVFARMTARNNAELEVMVHKAINYEKNPPTSPEFYNHPVTALGWQTERWFQICSEVVGGYFRNVQGKEPVRINAVYSGNPETDPWSTADNTGAVIDYFGPAGLNYIPATPSELGGWSGGTPAMVNEALNAGSFLLQHRDHGFENGWGEPSYTSDFIPDLTNTDLSFIFSINCLTGKYNYSQECFAEKFHRYTYQGQPAGALGLLAASETSYSFVNDVYVWGVFDNMFPDFMPDCGTTPETRGMLPAFGNAAGKFFLKYSNWPYNVENKEVTYNLFHDHGDAFTCLYSEVPQDMSILHSPVQIAGTTTFSINADQDALIAISVDGNIIGIATGTGTNIDIPIVPQNPPAILDVVVTKQNYYRYHSRVIVIPPVGPFVIADNYTLTDPAGNSNGKLDYGESVTLDMRVKNLGNVTSENTVISITSDDEYAIIEDGTADAGIIPPGETVDVPGAFTIMADGTVPNGHNIQFNLQASNGDTTWNSTFFVKAYAPVLQYVSYSISDTNGNSNGRLDPGETADLTVSVTNKGASDAFNIYGILNSVDPYIQVVSDSAIFGNVPQNATVSRSFSVSSLIITPPGHVASFNVGFRGHLGVSATGQFTTIVGLFPLLILDLDGNHNSADKMKDAIDNFRIFSEVSTALPDDISFYKTIFICLGTYSDNHVLTSTEAAPFIDFLNNGGNLYIEGADTWYYDQVYYPTILHPMFNITGASDGSSDLGTITGIPGTFTQGMSFYFTGDNDYVDHLTPVDPAINIFSNATPSYNVAIANDAGTYKTIGSSFEFGGLLDNGDNTRNDLMKRYLGFFGMDPISQLPAKPSGDSIICTYNSSSEYSTHSVTGAAYYIWELNPPLAGTIDGWDTIVTVNWTPGYVGNSTLRVYGMNNNGLGPVSQSLLIKRAAPPTADISFTTTEICEGDTAFAQIILTGQTPWLLIVNMGGSYIPMYSTKTIMDGIHLSPAETSEVTLVSVTDGNGCVSNDFPTTLITVHPLPAKPAKPAGLEYIGLLSGTQSVYNTAGSDSASSYEWHLDPAGAGSVTVSQDGLDCTVDWVTSYTGTAILTVKGLNSCGESDLSEPLAITVANTYGIEENGSGLGINVYPNPGPGSFRIDFRSEYPARATIRLYTSTGGLAWGPVEIIVSDKLSIPVNEPLLSRGMYLLKIETDKGISSHKIVVKK